MKKILITGFKDPKNSSEILLNKLKVNADKLYISVGFAISKKEFIKAINKEEYDYIISFGQKPVTKKLYIELCAHDIINTYKTNYKYQSIIDMIENTNYDYKLSKNAGNHYCNFIYYLGLNYIKKHKLKTKMIFIRIPYLDKINNMEELVNIFSEYINAIKCEDEMLIL